MDLFYAAWGIVGETENKPFSARTYNIVFIGGLGREKDIASEVKKLKNVYGNGIASIIETLLNDVKLDLEDYIEQLIELNDDPINRAAFATVMSVFSVIDIYIRYLKRKKLLESLVDGRVSVCIFGNGWDALSEKARAVHTLMGSVDHSKVGSIMGIVELF